MALNSSTDILIIGGGIAATIAAIHAAKYPDIKVTLVDKGMLGRSGLSATTGGGICAALTPPDNYETHLKDAVRVGTINDVTLTEIMTREAPKRLEEICEIGVKMHEDYSGNLYQIGGPTFTNPRIALAIGGGYALTEVLRKEAFHRGVSVIEDLMVLEIVVSEGKVAGVIAISRKTGEIFEIEAKAVIIAAGGAEGLYKYVSSNYVCTGDAYALAFRCGAKLANMEFQEFGLVPCPNDVITPAAGIGELLNNGATIYSEPSKKSIGALHPDKSFIVGMYEEVFVNNNKVYLDATELSKAQLRKFSSSHLLSAKLREGKIDFWNYPKFEIMPALRKFYGGILMDADCKTNVRGLFAAGESTTGSQGARRLEGDGIGGALVFGCRAAKSAVDFIHTGDNRRSITPTVALAKRTKELTEELPSLGTHGEIKIDETKEELRNLMWKNLGIVRERDTMNSALIRIRELRRVSRSSFLVEKLEDLVGWLEIQNMLLVSEMVACAALKREESRGFHFRKDHPAQHDKLWQKWILVSKSGPKTCFNEEIDFEVFDVPSGSRFSELMKQLAKEQKREEPTPSKPVGFEMVGD